MIAQDRRCCQVLSSLCHMVGAKSKRCHFVARHDCTDAQTQEIPTGSLCKYHHLRTCLYSLISQARGSQCISKTNSFDTPQGKHAARYLTTCISLTNGNGAHILETVPESKALSGGSNTPVCNFGKIHMRDIAKDS